MTKLTYISPFFIVTDLKTSVSFYVDKLEFETKFISPERTPFFAIVGRDDISIMLKEIAPEVKPVPNYTRHKWARWDAFIYVNDPDELFEEYKSMGLSFRQPIPGNEDGLRGFELADADGYVLYFAKTSS